MNTVKEPIQNYEEVIEMQQSIIMKQQIMILTFKEMMKTVSDLVKENSPDIAEILDNAFDEDFLNKAFDEAIASQ